MAELKDTIISGGITISGNTINFDGDGVNNTATLHFNRTVENQYSTTNNYYIDFNADISNAMDGSIYKNWNFMRIQWNNSPTIPTLSILPGTNISNTMQTGIGNSNKRFNYAYINYLYTDLIYPGTDAGVTTRVYGNFNPNSNASSSTTGYTLGVSNQKWRTVYAYTGTIQTSNRDDKNDIHYIDEVAPMKLKSKSVSNTDTVPKSITSDMIVDFIKKLKPANFVYGNEETIDEALSSNHTEAVQLGLIADDIKDEPLFNYIGAIMEYDKEIEPAEVNEETGEIIKKAVTEKDVTLGLKPIPLAVLALTCCKQLIDRVEELESKTN